jgi:hypothetical protein
VLEGVLVAHQTEDEHDRPLPHPYQFISQNHPYIRGYPSYAPKRRYMHKRIRLAVSYETVLSRYRPSAPVP